MIRPKKLLAALLAGSIALATLTPAGVAHATDVAETPAETGSMTIAKVVSGSGVPSTDATYEFTVTKGGEPAVGSYSVDGGESEPISPDGKIELKAGQEATLTGLVPGDDYVVEETIWPAQNYKFTSFSVNGGEQQVGTSTSVTVTADPTTAPGGWEMEGGSLKQDDDGYFTYVVTQSQLDQDGYVTVDCDPVAEYMEAVMRDYENWSPRSFKIKFVNETGVPIKYEDYSFDTVNWIPTGETYAPSGDPAMLDTNEGASSTSAGYGWGEAWSRVYQMLVGQTPTAGSLATTGFDGNGIRLAMAPLRCINPAVVSFFNSNPGMGVLTGNSSTDSAQKVTLLQMNALPELIKQEFTFKNYEGEEVTLPADANRTYSDFICAFYGVGSLDELTVAQKYNVLGTGSKGSPAMRYDGQSAITTYYSNLAGSMANWCVPYDALNDGTLDYFKTWGFSEARVAAGKSLKSGGQTFSDEDAATYAYQQDYYLLESDPEMLRMAYDYLYSRCIRFSLDTDDRPVPSSIDNSATSDESVAGIKEYMDKTDAASANVLAAMNGGAEVESGDSLTLDGVGGYIEVPNAWNQFRYYDFGFSLTFKADLSKQAKTSVTFENVYEQASENPQNPATPATPNASGDGKEGSGQLPQTGDESPEVPFVAIAGAAVLVIAVVSSKRRDNSR